MQTADRVGEWAERRPGLSSPAPSLPHQNYSDDIFHIKTEVINKVLH